MAEVTIDITKEVHEAAQESMRDHLVIGKAEVEIPIVVVIGEDTVSTAPEAVSIVLDGHRLEMVNKIRRALVTNRDQFLGGDHNFGTNQDVVNWLLNKLIGEQPNSDEGATDDNTTT